MGRVTWMDFGRLLRQMRERAGLSQERLASLVGCDRTHIWRLEHGKRHPSRVLLRALARLMDPTPAERRMLVAFDQMLEHHDEELV